MAKPSSAEITTLLGKYGDGDPDALNQIIPIVYKKLLQIAQKQISREGSSHTLSPTALVHEAFLRLNQTKEVALRDREHFFAVATRCMKLLLIDYARAKKSEKRGGASPLRIAFDEKLHSIESNGIEVTILSEVLERLEQRDERLSQVLELHFLVGLTIEEVATMLKLSVSTVKRDLTVAKMWLKREIDLARKGKAG